ncbi:PREDICTED: uncharacterized protein LOC108773929 [Cyphomyrmex costatus]|uniref:uncharacterized protein LOC108773929 n=1 Tax=Cyphomyrmex costatus TaxID=456900 RepID=UPI000852387C|nr:PREDICTED: uncharacterized protein LOC108773929 [Cyphomyrmex costatus]
MQQLSQQQSESQALNNNSDVLTRLFEQQAQLMRSIANTSNASNPDSRVKLPVIKLPMFDGRTEEWKCFLETFMSMIHTNENILSLQKFQYLVTSLNSNAAKVVESIELTAENYEIIAWRLLKKRYDDPRAINKKHIECLFTMPKIGKESATAIRSLVDYVLRHLRVLKSMNLPTDSWRSGLSDYSWKAKNFFPRNLTKPCEFDYLYKKQSGGAGQYARITGIIEYYYLYGLDTVTLRAWEQDRSATDTTLTALTDFLERRCQMLERIEVRGKEGNISAKQEASKHKPKAQEKTAALANVTATKVLPVPRTCMMGTCRECSGKHNTLCHHPTKVKDSLSNKPAAELTTRGDGDKASSNVVVHHAARVSTRRHVIMATAVVNAMHSNGSRVPLRILLDSASEAHFITHATCNRLRVKRDRASEIVTGLSETESVVSQVCEVVIQSRYSDVCYSIRGLIVPKITKSLPCVEIDRDAFKVPTNVQLADPEFYKRGSIDMLIGAEFFFDWLESERIELGNGRPILQNTQLGWVVAGAFTGSLPSAHNEGRVATSLVCSVEQCDTLNKNLQRFWAWEDYKCEEVRTSVEGGK